MFDATERNDSFYSYPEEKEAYNNPV